MHDMICGSFLLRFLLQNPSNPLCSSLLPLWMRRCSLRWCLYLKAFPHWLHLNFLFSRPGSDMEFWKRRAVMSMLCFCMCVVSNARVWCQHLAVEGQVSLHMSAVRCTVSTQRTSAVSSIPVLTELHVFLQRRVAPVRPLDGRLGV